MQQVRHELTTDEADRAADARSRVRDVLGRSGLSHLADTAGLLVVDLVSTAARRASGPFELVITLGPRSITVAVAGHSPAPPARRPDDDADTHLQLVAALADGWGRQRGPVRTRFWFRLDND
jgi:hypothetical protein